MKWRDPYPTDAESLVRQMADAFFQQAKDEGFTKLELDVWENFGWHYCLRGDMLNFHPSGVDLPCIRVLAGSSDKGAGNPGWFPEGRYETFTDAYNATLSCCSARLEEALGRVHRIRAHKPIPTKAVCGPCGSPHVLPFTYTNPERGLTIRLCAKCEQTREANGFTLRSDENGDNTVIRAPCVQCGYIVSCPVEAKNTVRCPPCFNISEAAHKILGEMI